MNLWMVRAGKRGEQEATCLEKGLVTISWNSLPDLSQFKSLAELKVGFRKYYNEKSKYSEGSKVGQIWRFANEIKKGDIVVLPSKHRPEIYVGNVKSGYEYKKITDEVMHIIPVEWKGSIPRFVLSQDLLYSFGSLLTVSKITRNNALQKVQAAIRDLEAGVEFIPQEEIGMGDVETDEIDDSGIENAETEGLAFTRIETFIRDNFKEYAFEELIREILKTHEYRTMRTKEIGDYSKKLKKGADGGVDLLASKGHLGFDQPTICVQVKSGQGKLPPKELRELVGVMATFKANHGLLVSWGGFSDELIREAREKYFTIRLWNSYDIINQILENYEKFSEEFKNKMPLKKIWVLDESEEK